jgi:nucleoside-diphosphate-sugar epimerase
MSEQKEVVLISGCSGRIGFKAAERFSDEYQIVGFDVFLAGHLPDVEFVVMDMASEESIKEGLEYVKKNYGGQIASVIHLAAYYSFKSRWSSQYDRITVKGTQRLLKGLQDFDVEQFIFSSSMLAHQPCSVGQKITEDSPLSTAWGYPLSKVQTEELIRKERGNIPCVNLRIAGVYDDTCHSIPLSNQVQRIYEDQPEGHLFAGDITHGASFIHMDDLIEALWLCVKKRKVLPPELALLLGEPKTLSYEGIQRQMQRLIHQREWKTWSIPKPIAKIGAWCQEHLPFMKESFIKPWMIDFADDHYELDITRARKFLGWEPKRKLEETIPLWIKELERDPITWYDENRLRAPRGLGHRR